jgi:hypothetical protein
MPGNRKIAAFYVIDSLIMKQCTIFNSHSAFIEYIWLFLHQDNRAIDAKQLCIVGPFLILSSEIRLKPNLIIDKSNTKHKVKDKISY